MQGNQALTICSPQVGIDPQSHLGGGVSDRETLKALAGLGTRIVMPLPRGEPFEAVSNWEIIPTRRHRWKYYEYNLIFRRVVLRLIQAGRTFDLVRAHSAHSTGPGVLWAARRYGIPCHLDYHHWERHWLRNWIERRTMGRYDLVTTPSDYSRRVLVKRYALRNRVEAVAQGIRPAMTDRPIDPDLRARYQDKRLLLHVGVLVPRKNLSFLLGLVRRLRDQGRNNLVLVLVGSGPLESVLRHEADEAGLGNTVEFAGRLSEDQKAAYYQLCDVFVFPSLLEGFGMAAGEAMAYGKPVVASNRTAIPEVVKHGETGFLADPSNEHDFAERIVSLLDSPRLCREMGEAGRRRVAAEFSFQRKAERLLAIYEELAARRK